MIATTVKETRLTGAAGTPLVLFEPEAPGDYACVLIMPERYGLVRHIIEQAQRLATAGFIVGAPDLQYDHPDQERLHAGTVEYKPSDEVILRRAEDVVAVLAGRPGADVSRLGMIGICQSGRYPFVWGAAHPIAAAVVFYGACHAAEWNVTPIHPYGIDGLLAQMKRTNVLGIFGEDDHVISIGDVLRFRNELEKRNHSYQITMVPGVPHGWLNDTMPGRYRPREAQENWAELLAFLRVKLAPNVDGSVVEWTFRSRTSVDYDFSKKIRYE
jgi:carboxymethylenebutenolidase